MCGAKIFKSSPVNLVFVYFIPVQSNLELSTVFCLIFVLFLFHPCHPACISECACCLCVLLPFLADPCFFLRVARAELACTVFLRDGAKNPF